MRRFRTDAVPGNLTGLGGTGRTDGRTVRTGRGGIRIVTRSNFDLKRPPWLAASFFIYIRALSPPPLSAIRFTWGLARRVSFHMHNSGRHPCVAVRHFLTELWKGASSTAGGGNDADCYHRDGRAGHHLRDAFHCADSIVGTAVPACHGAVWPTLIPRMVHVRRYRVEAWWSLSGVSSFVGRGTLP